MKSVRVRRLLAYVPWLALVVGMRLIGRGKWAGLGAGLCVAVALIGLVQDALAFARTSPEKRAHPNASSRIIGLVSVFALFAAPIALPTFAGHRLGWLLLMLGVVVAAWIATELLGFAFRTLASFAVERQ